MSVSVLEFAFQLIIVKGYILEKHNQQIKKKTEESKKGKKGRIAVL